MDSHGTSCMHSAAWMHTHIYGAYEFKDVWFRCIYMESYESLGPICNLMDSNVCYMYPYHIWFTWVHMVFYGSICLYRLRCIHIFTYTEAYAFIRIHIVLDMNKDVLIRTHVHPLGFLCIHTIISKGAMQTYIYIYIYISGCRYRQSQGPGVYWRRKGPGPF